MQKKRKGTKPVDTVSYNGIRYEALQWGKAIDLEQNGGYIVAYNEANDEKLWTLKVYDVYYDGDMEDDKQDVFITNITIGLFNKNILKIKNEKGKRFVVNLADKTVRPHTITDFLA